MNKKKNLYHSSGNSGERWYKVTKREAYLSFKCWHCKYLESGSGECLCGETESDECTMPEYNGAVISIYTVIIRFSFQKIVL